MLNIIILCLICTGLVIHRYLTEFWEQGQLPYAQGFLIFVVGFVILYAVNFVWMFGFVIGIAITLCAVFQIITATLLWPFTLYVVINMNKKPKEFKLSMGAYSAFSLIVVGLFILTIINFFISDYGVVTEYLLSIIDIGGIGIILGTVGFSVLFGMLGIYISKKYSNAISFNESRSEKILNEMENEFGLIFNVIRGSVERDLEVYIKQMEHSTAMELDQSIQKFVYLSIANFSEIAVSSGQYHLYRGILNPSGDGGELLGMFEKSLEKSMDLKAITEENVEIRKNKLYEEIKNIG